jgi:hypothetical protein
MFDLHIHINDKNLKKIMASIQELSEKVDALQVSLDLEQEAVNNAIAGLSQTIADLQALIVDGGTAEQRQELADKLDAIKADLEGTVDEGEVAPV